MSFSHWKRTLLIISLFCYLCSMVIVFLDNHHAYRWISFSLSILPTLLVLFVYLSSLKIKVGVIKNKEKLCLLLIVLLAVISRFYLLGSYPFVSLGDEVRDSGYHTQRIARGEITNLFEYGSYSSQGLIIPTLTLPFLLIFKNSVFVYRFPAAFVSIFDIVLIFLLLTNSTKNKLSSFLGTLAIISLPLHLYYSRTEFVVILSSLFSTAIIIGLYSLLNRKMNFLEDFIYLGTICGFCFGLHGSIKAMALIVVMIILLKTVSAILVNQDRHKYLKRLLIFVLFIFIGFGPRLQFTKSFNIFFNTSRLPFTQEKSSLTTSVDEPTLVNKYIKSLAVWVTQPTRTWYPDKKPILTPLLFTIMMIGIIATLFEKDNFKLTLITVALLLHMTNSALTNEINQDHRFGPLWPISALFIGYGVNFIFQKIKSKPITWAMAASLSTVLFLQVFSFFNNQPANFNKNSSDYLSMHLIYFLQDFSDSSNKTEYQISLSPKNFQEFITLHHQEQREFFLPNLNLIILQSENLTDFEIKVQNNSIDTPNQVQISCTKNSLLCPIDQDRDYSIFY